MFCFFLLFFVVKTCIIYITNGITHTKALGVARSCIYVSVLPGICETEVVGNAETDDSHLRAVCGGGGGGRCGSDVTGYSGDGDGGGGSGGGGVGGDGAEAMEVVASGDGTRHEIAIEGFCREVVGEGGGVEGERRNLGRERRERGGRGELEGSR